MKTEVDHKSEQMRRYLLGALTEPEQIALEQDFFADSETLEQMRAVESELVDGYARGRLGRAERQQFERHYLPSHRERIAFAGQLVRAADEQTAPDPAVAERTIATVRASESFWEKLLAVVRVPQFALGAALAAATLLFIGGGWFVMQKALWQQRLTQAASEAAIEQQQEQQRRRELESQIAQSQERNTLLNAELERLRQQQAHNVPPSTPTQTTLLSFLLLPAARGASEQQIIKIPSGANQIRLRMRIERGDHQRYQVSLRPVDGGAAWSPSAVSASLGHTTANVSVTVPSGKLKTGDYILTLSGVNTAGEQEEINRYFFRVGHK